MSLSADLIVSAMKREKISVVLYRRSPAERTLIFVDKLDNSFCLAIVSNQMNLLELGMADTRSYYKRAEYQKAFNDLITMPVN